MGTNKVLGMIGLATKAGKVSFGREQVIEGIARKKVSLVILAQDSSNRTKQEIQELCLQHHVTCVEYETIENLSNAIGKGNKAILGITSKRFSREIEDKIEGGVTNGKNG